MSRTKILAGNWKMNLTYSQARSLASNVEKLRVGNNTEVILGCPAPYLDAVNTLVRRNKKVFVAAQNAHHEAKGAYTGETSHQMLHSIGVGHVILGHSERRQYNKETNSLLKKKLNAMIGADMKVIFCCGEPLSIRKKKAQDKYVHKQLKDSLFHLTATQMAQITIAYEPIWAIGTGETATPSQAQSMHKHIRSLLRSQYGTKVANSVSILYGGSVKPKNAKELFGKPDVDGGLVGGASLDFLSFKKILQSFG